MEQLKRGQAIVGFYEETVGRLTQYTIEVTTIKDDAPATEIFQLSQLTFSNLKRALSTMVSNRTAKTHDMGQHFMLDVDAFIEAWSEAARKTMRTMPQMAAVEV